MKVSRGSQKLHREKVYVYEEAIQGREKPLGTLLALTHYQEGALFPTGRLTSDAVGCSGKTVSITRKN